MSDARPPHVVARHIVGRGYEYVAELLGALADELQRDGEHCRSRKREETATKLHAAAISLCDAQAAVGLAWCSVRPIAAQGKATGDVDVRSGGESVAGSGPRG